MSDKENVEFKDAVGLPGNAHAKKLAKDKASLEKIKAKLQKIFFTVRDGKILQIIAKPNGAHSNYLTSVKKYKKQFGEDAYQAMIAKWKKDGEYVDPHDDSALSPVVAELAEKLAKAKAK